MKCICDMCDGTGYVKEASNCMDYPYVKKCPKCKGSGYKVEQGQTNEEWFCSLPIKKKAEVFRKFQDRGFMARSEVSVVSLPTTNEIEEWLKQPHTNKGVKE